MIIMKYSYDSRANRIIEEIALDPKSEIPQYSFDLTRVISIEENSIPTTE